MLRLRSEDELLRTPLGVVDADRVADELLEDLPIEVGEGGRLVLFSRKRLLAELVEFELVGLVLFNGLMSNELEALEVELLAP